MTALMFDPYTRARASSYSSSSSSSSSEISNTSTIEYGHESFRTFERKILDLVYFIPQMDIFTSTAVKVTRMGGGFNYRIIGISTFNYKAKVEDEDNEDKEVKDNENKEVKDKTVDNNETKYILRIPRRERNNNTHLNREVAVLYYLEVHASIPVPTTIAFDLDGINGCPIELPYVLQTHVAGIPLDQALDQMDFGEKKRFVSKIVDLYVKMDQIYFERSGVLVPASGSRIHRILEVTAFDLGPESEENDRYRTYPQSTTYDMLLSQFECWKIVAGKKDQCPHVAGVVSGYMDQFAAIATRMREKGWLRDNKNILFHPDLSPYHIFVVRTERKSKVDWKISGIIDWDGALSVPRVMSNRVPTWLWRWGSEEGYDAREEGGDGNNPVDRDREALKHQFETEISAALPKFLRHAYKPKYQLLRKLCRFAIWGLRWQEDLDKAKEFVDEWNRVMTRS
ncbi:hypothetical protein Q9L58_000919 [Maublancomyces gigas]|uniref:Aminoglycoside phosphotransferase domain-containing protein n=1 Tax=Discina gigas TaxID=1032678 RepID=A0ABR3GWZ4_9PEZI